MHFVRKKSGLDLYAARHGNRTAAIDVRDPLECRRDRRPHRPRYRARARAAGRARSARAAHRAGSAGLGGYALVMLTKLPLAATQPVPGTSDLVGALREGAVPIFAGAQVI